MVATIFHCFFCKGYIYLDIHYVKYQPGQQIFIREILQSDRFQCHVRYQNSTCHSFSGKTTQAVET